MNGDDLVTASWLAKAGLPGIPKSKDKVHALAAREGWPVVERRMRGGPAKLYALTSLPAEAQVVLSARATKIVAPTAELAQLDQIPSAHLDRAREQLRVVITISDLVLRGAKVEAAIDRACEVTEHAPRTARRWFDKCRHSPRHQWLAILLPKWKSASAPSECHADAFAYFVDDYLRPAQPAFSACYRRMLDVAKQKQWEPIPSLRAMIRKLEREVPATTVILRREGREAIDRLYPAQERTRSHMHALFAVNADGHKFDVFVRWPGIKKPVRVCLVAFQDLYSGMILGWRIDSTENADAVRLALADVVEHYGIPEHCYLDNGRAFASKWLTGRMTNRFRFKIREEEPKGVMTELLGSEGIHWTTPYHGQAKPIERAFRDLCETIAKHPAFAGAYTGNSPTSKPDDYGSSSVDLDTFVKIVSALIDEHNQREGRRTEVCAGRSFADTFASSYAAHPVRRATEAQRRLLFLAAEGVQVRSAVPEIHLCGARYHSVDLTSLRGKEVIARFDPHHLAKGVFVYRLDGTFVCHATAQEKVPFDHHAAAKHDAKQKRGFRKSVREIAEKHSIFSPAELAALHLDSIGVSVAPSAKVVKLPFGLAATAPEKAAVAVGPTADELARKTAREELIASIGESSRAALVPRRSAG